MSFHKTNLWVTIKYTLVQRVDQSCYLRRSCGFAQGRWWHDLGSVQSSTSCCIGGASVERVRILWLVSPTRPHEVNPTIRILYWHVLLGKPLLGIIQEPPRAWLLEWKENGSTTWLQKNSKGCKALTQVCRQKCHGKRATTTGQDQKGGRSHYTKRSLPHTHIYIYQTWGLKYKKWILTTMNHKSEEMTRQKQLTWRFIERIRSD